jgi:hypothetical protein
VNYCEFIPSDNTIKLKYSNNLVTSPWYLNCTGIIQRTPLILPLQTLRRKVDLTGIFYKLSPEEATDLERILQE